MLVFDKNKFPTLVENKVFTFVFVFSKEWWLHLSIRRVFFLYHHVMLQTKTQVFVLFTPFSFVKQTCFGNHCLGWKPPTSLASTRQKRLNVGKCSKKTHKKVYFLLSLFEKLANSNSSSTLTFSFKKKSQKLGLRTNRKVFWSFCFLICQKKAKIKRQIVFALLLNKNIVRFGVRENKGNKKETSVPTDRNKNNQ